MSSDQIQNVQWKYGIKALTLTLTDISTYRVNSFDHCYPATGY